MKKQIRTRLEYFLAKVAGYDVDITELVPPMASDATEELLEEIADKINVEPAEPVVAENVPHAAGSAPTKEEFDALIDALIECGLMKPAPEPGNEVEPDPEPGVN